MKLRSPFFCGTLPLGLALCGSMPVWAQNAEEVPLQDAPPLASGVKSSAGETVTIPRSVWEQILRDLEDLKKSRGAVVPGVAPGVAPSVLGAPRAVGVGEPAPASSSSRNYLLLPDISFIGNTKALFSSDRRDEGRNAVDLEAEIGIQGFVYPGVKYDAFIVANPGEDEPFGIEEGFVTFLGAAKNLNVQVGRKFAAFGRTGELHPHSWLYSRQLLPRKNLVAGENLVGNGVQLNYLLPTGKNFFARLQLGAFSGGEESSSRVNSFDTSDPFEGAIASGPGAGFSRFYNARLWMGTALSARDELDFGVSYARGRSSIDDLQLDTDFFSLVNTADGRARLSGVDLSFRRYTGTNSRLLLRGEYFKYKPQNLPTREAKGYYALANYRFNKQNDLGFLYEKSDFPTAPGQREKSLSLIYTKQFAERYYVRFTGTRGDRPGQGNVNEFRVQFVTGLGPHTHELE